MHVEHLDWLAKNPRYTQRFAMQVGKLCRDMPNQIVAETPQHGKRSGQALHAKAVAGACPSVMNV